MNLPTQLFIDGAFRDAASGGRIALTNPATEETFADVAAAEVRDVDAAVDSAHAAWESGWRDLAPGKRAEILFNVARTLREHREEIAQLETREIGKPISDARDEAALGNGTRGGGHGDRDGLRWQRRRGEAARRGIVDELVERRRAGWR